MKKEVRTYNAKIEFRAAEDGQESRKITGYAAVFDKYSEEMWGFYERIKPGAFAEVLTDDVRALFNHDCNHVLGRSRAGTLSVKEDENGLAVEIELPDTQTARDLCTSMERGDIDQMSFAFTVAESDWDAEHDGKPVRTINKIKRLYDVSVVTVPAYPDTSADVRAHSDIFKEYQPQKNDLEILKLKTDLKLREVM